MAFLKWTITELAEASDVGISTVQEVEKIDGEPWIISMLQWMCAPQRLRRVILLCCALSERGTKPQIHY